MNSKSNILAKLASQKLAPVPLPDLKAESWVQFPDLVQQFRTSLEMVGGVCHEVRDCEHVAEILKQQTTWNSAKRIWSAVEGIPGNVNLDDLRLPHDLQDLDFVISPGHFAVAENGAVWLTDSGLKHRVVYFITQFLVLVVSKKQIVHHMYEAYERIPAHQWTFGVFLSGPSKTADIEQSLVIGAHGCRELQVFLID